MKDQTVRRLTGCGGRSQGGVGKVPTGALASVSGCSCASTPALSGTLRPQGGGQRSEPPPDGRGHAPAWNPGRRSELRASPPRAPGTFSFSSQLRGFPGASSIGPAAEQEEQPPPPLGLPLPTPGAGGAPRMEGTRGTPSLRSGTAPRAVHLARHAARGLRTRSRDRRATGRGRRATGRGRRAADEARGLLGAEVRGPPEVVLVTYLQIR